MECELVYVYLFAAFILAAFILAWSQIIAPLFKQASIIHLAMADLFLLLTLYILSMTFYLSLVKCYNQVIISGTITFSP